MDIQLTGELEQIVHRRVRSGQYGSPVEVLSEALHLLETRDSDDSRRQQISARIREGVESLDRGEGVDGEAFFDELISDLEKEQKA